MEINHPVRQFAKRTLMRVLGWLSSEIVDYETGENLGRAFVIAWRGRIYVWGLRSTVIPIWRPQERLTYAVQELVFVRHPSPDFPHEPRS